MRLEEHHQQRVAAQPAEQERAGADQAGERGPVGGAPGPSPARRGSRPHPRLQDQPHRRAAVLERHPGRKTDCRHPIIPGAATSNPCTKGAVGRRASRFRAELTSRNGETHFIDGFLSGVREESLTRWIPTPPMSTQLGRRPLAAIAAPCEDQVGVDVVAARNHRHRDAGSVAPRIAPATATTANPTVAPGARLRRFVRHPHKCPLTLGGHLRRTHLRAPTFPDSRQMRQAAYPGVTTVRA